MKKWKKFAGMVLYVSVMFLLSACDEAIDDEKPVIYLYPEQEQKVSVQLLYDGKITCTYPGSISVKINFQILLTRDDTIRVRQKMDGKDTAVFFGEIFGKAWPDAQGGK